MIAFKVIFVRIGCSCAEREAMELNQSVKAELVVSVANGFLYDPALSGDDNDNDNNSSDNNRSNNRSTSSLCPEGIKQALTNAHDCLSVFVSGKPHTHVNFNFTSTTSTASVGATAATTPTKLHHASDEDPFVLEVANKLRLIAAMQLLPSLGLLRAPVQVLQMTQKMQLIEEVINVHRKETSLHASEFTPQFQSFVETILHLAQLLDLSSNEDQMKVILVLVLSFT